ncbi:hypothetical protein [Saccharothrix algeriensis]|uniref:Lipoprotein n=2 Tax=Saccharothrix algeriensis TaxID=173560 RepID=A0ABS2S780_9PSEU|nr:hypothetical protein [Saccharothrix algeriensis]MBM7812083.1 hypothetical protein [Saccharothrix algeriensis]
MVPAVLLTVVAGCSAVAGCTAGRVQDLPRPTPTTVVETVVVDDVPVLGPEGVGRVRLGMTLAELEATGEVGGAVELPTASCPVRSLERVRGWVGVDGGVAAEIRVEAGARTPAGLRIGDSRDRMRRLHPGVEWNQHGFTAAVGGDVRYKFHFMNAGDTLTSMGISRELSCAL